MRVVIVALAACGRLGFDASGDAAGDGAQSYVTTVLADHPLAYYRLDESSGTVARDSSGNGNDAQYGVNGGQLTYGRPGALARDPDTAVALAGDGNTQADVTFPAGTFAFAADFTVEGFVMPEAPPGGANYSFFGWEQYLNRGFRTGWNPELELEWWTHESGGPANTDTTSAAPLVAGQWSHVAFVRAAATIALYVDGQLASTGPISYLTPMAVDNGWLGSGEGMPGGTAYDELAIYDHALTAQQIATHYAASR